MKKLMVFKIFGRLEKLTLPLGLGSIAFSLMVLLALFGLAVPAFFPMVDMLANVGKDFRSGNYLFFLLSLFFWIAFLLYFKYTRSTVFSNRQYFLILGLLLIITLITRVWFVLSYDQEILSDFSKYWDAAIRMAKNGIESPNNIFIKRTIPVYLPLAYFFGSEAIIFKLYNVFSITFTALIITYISSRWISKRTAIAVFALISIFPETYYASLIPSHDIPGAFFLVICLLIGLLIIEKVNAEKYIPAILLTLLLSFFLIVMEFQRGLSDLFIYSIGFSFILFFLIYYSGQKIRLINIKHLIISLFLTVLAPYFLYNYLCSKTLNEINRISLRPVEFKEEHNRQAIRFNTFNDGTFTDQLKILEPSYVMKIEGVSYRNQFMTSLFLSDAFYDPLERIPNYFVRSHRLFRLSNQMYFYTNNIKNISEAENKLLNSKLEKLNNAFYSIFLAILIATILLLIFRIDQINFSVILPLLFMALLGLVLSVLLENQPRYLFLGYFLWPIPITYILSECFKNSPIKTKSWYQTTANFKKNLVLTTLYIILSSVIFYSIFAFWFKPSDLRMINLSEFEIHCDLSIEDDKCNKGVLDVPHTITDRKWSVLSLRMPDSNPQNNQFIKAIYKQQVKKNRLYAFEVFVQQPYKREDGKKGFLDIRVSANNIQQILHIEDTDEIQYVRLENIVPDNGKITIGLEVKCTYCSPNPSWQRASRTDFRFARLSAMQEMLK